MGELGLFQEAFDHALCAMCPDAGAGRADVAQAGWEWEQNSWCRWSWRVFQFVQCCRTKKKENFVSGRCSQIRFQSP